MTINKVANQGDVVLNSGLQGFDTTTHNTLPDELSVVTTGGGSYSTPAPGLSISAGATAGDSAVVKGLNVINFNGVDTFKTRITYTPQSTVPYTDGCQIGWGGVAVGDNGAYLDLKTGEYVVQGGNKTAKNATLIGNGVTSTIIIETDLKNNVTHFKSVGKVEESVTIQNAAKPFAYAVCAMDSNGGGDQVRLPYIRQTFGDEV